MYWFDNGGNAWRKICLLTYPRYIYIYILVLEIWSWWEEGETLVGRRRRNWQSFFPSSSPIPHFIPPSSSPEHRQNRGGTFRNPASFFLARHRALYFLYIRTAFRSQPFYSSPPRGSRLSKYFVILENGVSRKETDFTRERAFYARLNPIFLFLLLPRFVGILTYRNSSSLLFGKGNHRWIVIVEDFYLYFQFPFARIED